MLSRTRLVTLTGPGGSGKTRLAIEAAARGMDRMPDGDWFVPLAGVREALDVPQAVLAAIGIPELMRAADASGAARLVGDPVGRLADALAGRRLALLLDNCEHLLDAAARLAGRVLAAAPGITILATSREPLGIAGEVLCPVPSLPLPPPGADPAAALGYPAVRLFADRAAAVRPGFALDAATAGPVVAICRALDGIPLAIELAAARLRSLTAAQVADRLGDRFGLLATGSRADQPRHRTLRAVVDWSWDLLDESERAVLRRLAVFRDGATFASAAQVCAPVPGHRDLLDVIASLVDKSLVTAAGEDGDVRYRLLETVQVYASQRLAEAGEEGRVRRAHAACFLALAERAEPQLRGPEQVSWLDRLTAEHGNCAAALRHAIDTRDARLGLRFIAALAWYWMMRDYEIEAARWAAAVMTLAGDTPPPADLTDAMAICGFIAAVGQAAAQARPPATVLAGAGEPGATATADARPQAPPGTAGILDALQRALSLAGPGTRHPLLTIAAPMVALITGDIDRARRELRELAAHPDPWVRAGQRAFSGHLALNVGDLAEASAGLADGYAAFRATGDRGGMMVSLTGLAEVALARGEPGEAVRLLEQARQLGAEGLAGNWSEMLLIPLGRARARLDDPAGAHRDLDRGSARRSGSASTTTRRPAGWS